MRKSRYSDSQILAILMELRRGEICLEMKYRSLFGENPKVAVETSPTKTRRLHHVPLNSLAR